jgi:hypothetical protein
VHGQAVVRLGATVLHASADEVDAIVHTRIDARDTGSTSPLQGRWVPAVRGTEPTRPRSGDGLGGSLRHSGERNT